jgi:hypothetical protein
MSRITYFAVLPFIRNDDGNLIALEGVEVPSATAAPARASWIARTHGGAVAFSRTGDPAIGEFDDAEILAKVGDVPADLAEFTGARREVRDAQPYPTSTASLIRRIRFKTFRCRVGTPKDKRCDVRLHLIRSAQPHDNVNKLYYFNQSAN